MLFLYSLISTSVLAGVGAIKSKLLLMSKLSKLSDWSTVRVLPSHCPNVSLIIVGKFNTTSVISLIIILETPEAFTTVPNLTISPIKAVLVAMLVVFVPICVALVSVAVLLTAIAPVLVVMLVVFVSPLLLICIL